MVVRVASVSIDGAKYWLQSVHISSNQEPVGRLGTKSLGSNVLREGDHILIATGVFCRGVLYMYLAGIDTVVG